PEPALRRLCETTEIRPADVTGVATFYSQFRLKPAGEHLINVCHGTACHIKGAQAVTDALFRNLDIPEEEEQDTDPEGLFTVQKVACVGCCTLAPVMQIDGITYGHLTPDTVTDAVGDFLRLKELGALAQPKETPIDNPGHLAEVRIALDSCCVAGGARKVFDAFDEAIKRTGAPAVVKRVGCISMCHQVPVVEIAAPGEEPALYTRVQPEDAEAILLSHLKPASPLKRTALTISSVLERLLTDESWEPVTRYAADIRDEPLCRFLGRQTHIAIEGLGERDPISLEEYEAHGGFKALRRCLRDLSPEQIIDEVDRAGLRGRGGAGYPTGRKWRTVARRDSGKKYVVCNGDEGDPGAFMDRMLLESCPYRILEGIAIGARAVGADEATIYVRAEYPFAVRRLHEAIELCQERGYLGDRLLGTDVSLDVHLMEGAGAFVCGEETALIRSIEGHRGMPVLRPPYPAETGLWGRPTLINNVETFALVPWILEHGAEAFARLGTSESRGTKVFALAGKVKRGGLIEVPMGVTIREIVDEIGGGIAGDKAFKAAQIGGPSGGCVPARLADTPIDYEDLGEVGAIMGSGGLVVLDEDDCMIDVARYFLQFTQQESCGRCSFCRVGTRQMLDILERLCTGGARDDDLDRLEELCHMVARGSLCGLGATAPNPVLTTLEYFRDEYEAHVDGRCPAGRCKPLITYKVTDECIGCTRCAQHCPADAIEPNPYEQQEIDPEKCIRCDACRKVCPVDAIVIE
ncbi:MAG: NAD(P)H-dependent oxidoreductase subunit E, partial [Planctomycetota bacterium]